MDFPQIVLRTFFNPPSLLISPLQTFSRGQNTFSSVLGISLATSVTRMEFLGEILSIIHQYLIKIENRKS